MPSSNVADLSDTDLKSQADTLEEYMQNYRAWKWHAENVEQQLKAQGDMEKANQKLFSTIQAPPVKRDWKVWLSIFGSPRNWEFSISGRKDVMGQLETFNARRTKLDLTEGDIDKDISKADELSYPLEGYETVAFWENVERGRFPRGPT